MNALQQHILDFLREDVRSREAVIDAIESGLARYRVGDRDTTRETLVEYQARVSEAKELIPHDTVKRMGLVIVVPPDRAE